MGNENSATFKIPEDLIDDYLQLTYLNRSQILSIYKKLLPLNKEAIAKNFHQRLPWEDIICAFPELRVNPFADRLLLVFSSQMDGRLSFEDVLDLFSALSPTCPPKSKALWAFKLFDFDGSNSIDIEDMNEIMDRLTSGRVIVGDESKCLSAEEKERVANIIIDEIDLDHTGTIVAMEFVHAVSKMPDFISTFTLKL